MRVTIAESASVWGVDWLPAVAAYIVSTVLYLPNCVMFLQISIRMRRVISVSKCCLRFKPDGVLRIPSLFAILFYWQFCSHLCHAVGNFLLDIGHHLHTSSDVSDSDEYENWQDDDIFVVINTSVFVEVHNSGKQWPRSAITL